MKLDMIFLFFPSKRSNPLYTHYIFIPLVKKLPSRQGSHFRVVITRSIILTDLISCAYFPWNFIFIMVTIVISC